MKGKLLLDDGKEFFGDLLFPCDFSVGEVVFNTSMSGYQEIFSDPSYAGQIVVMTYPLIGNYGINERDFEAEKIQLKGIVLLDLYDGPIHEHSNSSLKDFLIKNKIPTLINVDCRSITKHIRSHGAMRASISDLETAFDSIKDNFEDFSLKTISKDVTQSEIQKADNERKRHIVLLDYGYKKSIKSEIEKRGCAVTVVPHSESFETIQALKPDGIVLSNGPGDPTDVNYSFDTVQKLQDTYPVFGICLGHQVLSLINGAKTYKMSFGHRGANHSVKDIKREKVFLSSHNHGYAVETESLKDTNLKLRFYNVNDETVAGIEHKTRPMFSVQFHPEAHSGPQDTSYLFDEFISMVDKERHI